MTTFANYLDKQKIYKFKDKIIFHRLDDYFIKDITIKRNIDWNFINKCPFELFHNYSCMKLNEVYNIYITNPTLFKEIINKLDDITKLAVLEPFSKVYNQILSIPESYEFFCQKVQMDLEKKNLDNNKENYYNLFEDNLKNFIKYYEKGLL